MFYKKSLEGKFRVYLFRDKKDRCPVLDYIKGLPRSKKKKVLAYINYLSEIGYEMKRPMADYLGAKLGLYELRPGAHRVIYYYIESNHIILLHVLRKSADKLKESDIRLALARKAMSEALGKHHMINYESL